MGYVRALSDERVIDVILSAPFGRIAVTYLEWAGPGLWRTIADWHVIDSAASAREFAGILAQIPSHADRGPRSPALSNTPWDCSMTMAPRARGG